MLDLFLAVLSIIAVIAYFLPLMISVPAPALFCVLVAVVLMAAYDFWRELRAMRSQ
jgi:hypothetical protein